MVTDEIRNDEIRLRRFQLGQELLDDVPCDVGEAKVAALVAIGQPSVIKAQAMHDCGLQIVDVDPTLDGVVAEIVCCTDNLT